MKHHQKKHLFIAIVLIAALSSCGKDPERIYGLTVSYPELTTPEQLTVIRIEKNNPVHVIDTSCNMVLDANNAYTVFLEFQESSPDLVLVVGENRYRDTIADIEIIKERKKNKSDIRYRWNRVLCDNQKLVIYSGKTSAAKHKRL
ncbi:MAG: hypothetical protein J6S82_10300 [Bacteroidales bacterium]|nr:hypothetical protein [Bacteroidales bacterium]